MNKTTKYILIIAALLAANTALLLSAKTQRTSSFDDSLFLVADTSQVSQVHIQYKDVIKIKRTANGWLLNDQFAVDENFRSILLTILNRVKIKKSVGTWTDETEGTVSIEQGAGTRSFEFATNPNRTKSYFISAGEAYEVEVPGYRDNVTDIFTLLPDQWRNRQIFDGSWRTIQKLELSQKRDNLRISFQDQFFLVEGIEALDSAGVVDYLNQFQLFRANEMISPGRFPELDSLRATEPLAHLAIDDIKYPAAITFKIFPSLEGQAYHLVLKNDEEMMVIGASRIDQILKSGADFDL